MWDEQAWLLKKEIRQKSKKFHRAYKDKRNEVNKLIKSAKFQYCKDNIELNKHNLEEYWNNGRILIRSWAEGVDTPKLPQYPLYYPGRIMYSESIQ